MSKKLVMRRVAILLALVVGIIQMQLGGAVTFTSYDFHASNQTIKSDVLAGGSASTAGSADKITGVVSSTANASSTQPAGVKDFSGPRGVGGNLAKRDSYIRKTFTGLVTGTYTVTITVDVSSLTTPTSGYTPGQIDAGLILACSFAPTCPYVPLTNSGSYSFVQLGGSVVDGSDSANSAVTYKSSDGGYFNEIAVGANTLVLSLTLDAPGSLIVELHLVSEAWAAGDVASASGGAIADVTSIQLT